MRRLNWNVTSDRKGLPESQYFNQARLSYTENVKSVGSVKHTHKYESIPVHHCYPSCNKQTLLTFIYIVEKIDDRNFYQASM